MADWGPFSLDGKVAVVTGGAAGIGLGIVRGLAEAGATVMGVGRRPDGAGAIAAVARSAGYFAADLADAAAPDAIIAEAVRRHGTVDILVNNAAMLSNTALEQVNAAYIDQMAAVNVRAPLLLARAFAIVRRQCGGGGKIVNIGSLEGFISNLPAGMAVYGTTKSAMQGMTVSLARELGPLRIGVNAIAPGAIMHDNLKTKPGEVRIDEDARRAVLARIEARTNVGRLGEPRDIAALCVFLAASASDYISGQVILADGGVTRT